MEDDIRSKNAVNQRKARVQLAPTDLAYQGNHGTPETFQLDEQDGVAGVSELEDLIEIVNPNGWWNITSLALGLMAFFMLPLQSVTYQFLGETPAHWCHVAPLTEANWTQQQIRDLAIPLSSNDTRERSCKFYNYNYTKAVEIGYEAAVESRGSISIGDGSPISCQARDFNVSHYSLTLVAEWDLVCEKRALYSTTQSASQFGNLLGDLTFPYFMAKYGRRPITLLCLVLCFVCALGAAVSPWYSFYVLLRIAVNFFCRGCYTGCFVYTLEISSHRQRSVVGSIGGVTWSFGFLAMPGIAYLVRPWRWMQVAFSAPMILLLVSYYWFIVESPRWLISQGRYEEAEAILSRIARFNGRAFPPSKAVVISLKKMDISNESRSEEASFRHIVRNLKEYFILILKQEHRAKILISYFCWFAVSLVYYGVSLNSGNLSADLYLYVALGSLAEFPCYPISWVLMVYVGRRLSLAICYWVSGVATCVVAILVASMDEVPFGLLMTFAMTGRVAISAAFVICYLYTAELFPTRLRSLAVGQSSVVGRVGSMLSPYINDILGALIVWAPLALFALLSALSGILCPLLPETRGSMIEEGASSPRAKEEGGGGVGVGGDPDNSRRRAEGQSVNEGFQED